MANRDEKTEENVKGRFYVDHTCIASKFCVGAAPSIFKMSEGGDHAYVTKQPDDAAEESVAQEALRGCPVEAIGDDGEL